MYPITRYHSLSILLHWLIALGLLFMMASGIAMVNVEMPKADQYQLFQIHKAAGVIMLWAIALRIVVRLMAQSPPLPARMPAAEQKLAKLGHVALYSALVVMPLSGWMMVSASPFGLPTFVFVEWIKWPHLPFVERNKAVENIARNVHWITAITLGTMIVGHVFAVFWHQKQQGICLIKRMWWSRED